MELANLKFDDLNAVCHARACVMVSLKFANLLIIHQITKLKPSPKFPAMWFILGRMSYGMNR